MNFPLRKGPTGPLVNPEDNPSVFENEDGYTVNVLPDIETTAQIAASSAAVTATSEALTPGYWYSTTVEVLLANSIVPTLYIYRNEVEFYRGSSGGAVLFYAPATPAVEQPAGGVYSVAISAVGNAIVVTVTNGSLAAITVSTRVGFNVSPIPVP